MPCYLDIADDAAISLAEASETLATSGFKPREAESVEAAALVLRRLGNNRDFLGDIILDELKARNDDTTDENAYGPQAIMLGLSLIHI